MSPGLVGNSGQSFPMAAKERGHLGLGRKFPPARLLSAFLDGLSRLFVHGNGTAVPTREGEQQLCRFGLIVIRHIADARDRLVQQLGHGTPSCESNEPTRSQPPYAR